jgi:hypothetical protein
MYLWLSSRRSGRIQFVARLRWSTLWHLLSFLGPGGIIRTVLDCRPAFRRRPHLALQQRWAELCIPHPYEFAYTSPHDDTHLQKAIFFSNDGKPVLYKAAFDRICSANLANELLCAEYFGAHFWLESKMPYSIATEFRYLFPVLRLSRSSVVSLVSAIAASARINTEDTLVKALTHGDLNRRNVKRRLGGRRRYSLVDFEFAGKRTLAYDYFYFYLNTLLRAGDVEGIVSFVQQDRKRELVIAAIDVGANYLAYFNAFLNEWLQFFGARTHDPKFAAASADIIERVRAELKYREDIGARQHVITKCA